MVSEDLSAERNDERPERVFVSLGPENGRPMRP
jgi:hypothetical protein